MKEARDLVRTFHSRILPMVRSLPGFERLQAFENLSAAFQEDEEATATRSTCASTTRSANSSTPVITSCTGGMQRFRELIATVGTPLPAAQGIGARSSGCAKARGGDRAGRQAR